MKRISNCKTYNSESDSFIENKIKKKNRGPSPQSGSIDRVLMWFVHSVAILKKHAVQGLRIGYRKCCCGPGLFLDMQSPGPEIFRFFFPCFCFPCPDRAVIVLKLRIKRETGHPFFETGYLFTTGE